MNVPQNERVYTPIKLCVIDILYAFRFVTICLLIYEIIILGTTYHTNCNFNLWISLLVMCIYHAIVIIPILINTSDSPLIFIFLGQCINQIWIAITYYTSDKCPTYDKNYYAYLHTLIIIHIYYLYIVTAVLVISTVLALLCTLCELIMRKCSN